MASLREFVLKTLPTRKNEKTGADLADYIEKILPIVNNNTDGGANIVEMFSHNACIQCFRDFTLNMQNITLPVDESELDSKYNDFKKASLECFDRNMPFEAQSYVMDKYKRILSERDEFHLENVRVNNTYHSYRVCMDMSRTAKAAFKAGNYASMAECKREMERAYYNVSKAIHGPKRKECLRSLYADLEGCAQNMAAAFASERIDRLFSTSSMLLLMVGFGWYLMRSLHITVPPSVGVALEYTTLALGLFSGFILLVGKTSITGFTQSDIIWVLDAKDSVLAFAKRYFIVILIGAALLFRLAFKYRPKSPSNIVMALLSTKEGRHIDDYEEEDDDDDMGCFSSDDDDEDDDDDKNSIKNYDEMWRRKREMVFFVENCGSPSTVFSVSKLLFRRSRRRRIILVVGWVHYLGLDFLPRNGVVHIVCSGPKKLSDTCEGWVIDAGSQVSEIETPGATENSNTEATSHMYNCVVDANCMDTSDKDLKRQFMRLRKHK